MTQTATFSITSLTHWPKLARPRTATALCALAAAGATLGGSMLFWPEAKAAPQARVEEMRQLVETTSGEQGAILREGAGAEERNALIPSMNQPVEHARAFQSIRAGTPAYNAALKCLSQAVYYEAANEPIAGRRGVAQVVLNRVQHPAYPNSVCGVVYQGANDPVCQFSFTCDGSLLRAPVPSLWNSAQRVAEAALGGYVEDSVGSATHYHADYVLPRWAYTLGKIDKLGRHIFYRFKGNAGRSSFLTARWSGKEAIPALDMDRLRGKLAARHQAEPVQQFVEGLTVTHSEADRHARNDVGGRIDTTKQWRLTIPDPVSASQTYRQTVEGQNEADGPAMEEGTQAI